MSDLDYYENLAKWAWPIIKRYNLESRLLNKSFNFFKINDPNQNVNACKFYTADVADEFLRTGESSFSSFVKYYDYFLKNKISTSLIDFLHQRLYLWRNSRSTEEKSIYLSNELPMLSDNLLLGYLFHKFVTSTFVGVQREINVKNELLSINNTFSIEEVSPMFDSKNSIDFIISNGIYKIGIQVKPFSFLRSIRTTSSYAAKKLNRSFVNNPTFPIFVIEHDENTSNVIIISKSGHVKKIAPTRFFKIFDKDLSFAIEQSRAILALLENGKV